MFNKSRPILISCGILRKELEILIEQKKLDVEPIFLDPGLHVVYTELEKEILTALEKAKDLPNNGIIVIYGDMCHPRIKKIVKQNPNTVKVDALNCIDCLLGGHKELVKVDPKGNHFFLSPGWMPSNLKKSKYFKKIFDWNIENIKEQFECLDGVIVIDSLGNLEESKNEIDEFTQNTGLQVSIIKSVGLERLKALIDESISKLKSSPKSK